MELAARRYARKVLLIHLVLLLVVLGVVAGAARVIYGGARQQATEQAKKTQELLARQTGVGIQNYYESITNVLNLLQPNDTATTLPSTRPAIGQAGRGGRGALSEERRNALRNGPLARLSNSLSNSIWENIRDKVSLLYILDPAQEPDVYHPVGSADSSLTPEQVNAAASTWLATVHEKSISPYMTLGGGCHLVVVPMRGPAHLLMVAVVPVRLVERELLADVNRSDNTGSMLIDGSDTFISSNRAELIGRKITDVQDPRVHSLAERYKTAGVAGTEFFRRREQIGGVWLRPGMSTLRPIEVFGQSWTIIINSNLDEVDNLVQPIFRDAMIWAVVVMLAMIGILGSTAAQLIRGRVRMEREQIAVLNRELTQARNIQLHWLPAEPYKIPGIDLAATNRPASHVSGDFYNFFELPDGRLAVIIGDVTGHGMAAAFLMATTQLLVRTTMPRFADPGACLEEVNRLLCTQVFNGQFVTMLLMLIDRKNGAVEVVSAGHFLPLIAVDGSVRQIEGDTDLVLGVDATARYRSTRLTLPRGAGLLLYTDGVIEAYSPRGERFGVQRMIKSLSAGPTSVRSMVDSVVRSVDAFRGQRDLADDLTLVAMRLQEPDERSG